MTRKLTYCICVSAICAMAPPTHATQSEKSRLTRLLAQQPAALSADLRMHAAVEFADAVKREAVVLAAHLGGPLSQALEQLSGAETEWTAQVDTLEETVRAEVGSAISYSEARAAYNRFLTALPNSLAVGRAAHEVRTATWDALELLHATCGDVAQVDYLISEAGVADSQLVEHVSRLEGNCTTQEARLSALFVAATQTERATSRRRLDLQQHWDAEVSKLAGNSDITENVDWMYIDAEAVEAKYAQMRDARASLEEQASYYYTQMLAPLMARRYAMMLKNVTREHRSHVDMMPDDFSHKWLFEREVADAEYFISVYDSRLAAYDDNAAADLHAWRVDDVEFYLSISTEPTDACLEAQGISTMHPRTTQSERVYIQFMEECI